MIKYLISWKYRYFKNKLRGVEKMIEDMEFKRYKTLEIREDVRVEYDNLKSRLAILDEKIKAEKEKPTLSVDEQKRMDDEKVIGERDLDRYKKQIDGMDLDVVGSKPSNEYPNGVNGLNMQLESLQELKGMIKEYLKTL